MEARAWDNRDVTVVTWYADGIQVAEDTDSASWSATWDTTTFPNGEHTMYADARDAAGNVGASESVTFVVDNSDRTPPTAPSGLTVTGATATALTLAWDASRDEVGVAGYGVYKDGTNVGSTQSTSFTFGNLSCGSTYVLAVDAYDAADNHSPQSSVTASTSACADTTPPTVTITAPASGAEVGGTTTLEASASDDVAVTKVTWYVDGAKVAEDADGAPWRASWDTTTVSDGSHPVYAEAGDAAGNVGRSPSVTFTVKNAAPVPSGPCGTSAAPPATYQHVIWIFMENRAYDQIIGSSDAPYLNELASACGLATQYSAITHPSLPNYIAATSGDYWGISDDDPPASHPLSVPSIYSQVKAAGLSWRDYEESAPGNCPQQSSGSYAVKHDPAPYYTNIRNDCATWDVPMGTPSSGNFANDLAANSLPAFAFVTPNLCNDMHDCSVSTGDAWLKSWVSEIVSSAAYRSGNTALFITWDEDDGSATNHIVTIVVSPSTQPGTASSTAFNHYSLLRTTEEMLGLPGYLGNAASAASMRAAFNL